MPRYQRVRDSLLTYRGALLGRLRDGVMRVNEELDERDPEEVERAAEQWDARVMSSLGDSEVRELKAIAAAIERIDSGTYGQCACCRGRIEAARLAAVPTTTMCLECALGEDAVAPHMVAS